MNRLLALLAVLLIGGCATPTVSKVEQGEQVVGERIVVKLDGPWNRFDNFGGFPVPTWTVEGVTVDRLQFFVGIKDGATLVPQSDAAREKRPLTFRKSMQPHEIVSLFQTMLTGDGSTFTLDKLDPVAFLGGQGIRFQYSLVRRVDEVRLSGFGYARVVGDQLHAIVYQAPRLGFYPRYQPQVDRMALTAGLRG